MSKEELMHHLVTDLESKQSGPFNYDATAISKYLYELASNIAPDAKISDVTNMIQEVTSMIAVNTSDRITIDEAHEILGYPKQAIRVGMQQGTLRIGFVTKKKTKYWYYISRKKCYEEARKRLEVS